MGKVCSFQQFAPAYTWQFRLLVYSTYIEYCADKKGGLYLLGYALLAVIVVIERFKQGLNATSQHTYSEPRQIQEHSPQMVMMRLEILLLEHAWVVMTHLHGSPVALATVHLPKRSVFDMLHVGWRAVSKVDVNATKLLDSKSCYRWVSSMEARPKLANMRRSYCDMSEWRMRHKAHFFTRWGIGGCF